MLNMVLVRSPVGFSEKIMTVFELKKIFKFTPKMTKVPKFPKIQCFYAFFVSTDFLDWKVLKGQQGINW